MESEKLSELAQTDYSFQKCSVKEEKVQEIGMETVDLVYHSTEFLSKPCPLPWRRWQLCALPSVGETLERDKR